LEILLTFAIAATGGIVGMKLNIPAGGLVGSMVAVALALAQMGGLRLLRWLYFT